MRTFALVLIVALLMLVASPALAAADTVSGAKLIEDPAAFDGKQVTISGELIGDYGFRDDGTVWAQLNDDAYALSPLRDGGSLRGANTGIGIHADKALFVSLDPPGRYNRVGPLVSVTGTWRYHDAGRGGESYLEVESLDVVRPGYPVQENTRHTVVVVGVLLAMLAAGLLVFGASQGAKE
ncbi:MAG: hypothetical protein GWP04_11075 [Gammaproteobacteria bacterium]|nr:hypothetical protein [Gammaproteobacteria bacterium]